MSLAIFVQKLHYFWFHQALSQLRCIFSSNTADICIRNGSCLFGNKFHSPHFLDASASQKLRRSCAEFFLMSDIKCCIKCQFCAYVQYLYLASGCGHKCVCFSPHPNARIRGYENTRIAGPQPCRWVSAGQVSVIKFVMSCRHGKGFLSAIYFISALLFLFPLSLWLAFLLAYFYGTRTAQSGIYI